MRIRRLALLVWCFCAPMTSVAQITPPDEFLHFSVGADRRLADWSQIVGYFEKLAKQSDRVDLVEIGRSTENRPLVMAIITSPRNLQRQQEIRAAMRKLADPRLLPESELAPVLDNMPTVVLLTCSIHSTEIGASQFSMQLAYTLASGTDTETLAILDDVVTLLVPSPNPDGIDVVVDWYRRSLGKPHEGLAPPQLYHKYAGHDNNRDWFMLNLPETRAVTRVLYDEWFPQILYDLHQQGRNGTRMTIPPFFEVTNPLIDPLILREVMLIGGHMATDLSAAGKKGVATETTYDMWWHGGLRTAPYFHNVVGLLTEAASAWLATPDTVSADELSGARRGIGDVRKFQTNMPEPWKGGVWRLRDIIDMEMITSRSLLQVASRYRRMWLQNFYRMGQRALVKGSKENPAAFVVPLEQNDPAAAQKLVEILLAQGVEVRQATARFVADGRTYPAGTFVIATEQPYRANVLALLDPQFYPERRQYPGGPIENPYDVTAWTLPLQMGVDVLRIENRFVWAGERLFRLEKWPVHQDIQPDADLFAVASSSNDTYRLMNRLLRDGIEVYWNTESVLADTVRVFPGNLVVPASPGNTASLRKQAAVLSVAVQSVRQPLAFGALALQPPRVGIYHSAIPNMDEGWTRYVFDDFGIAYTSLSDAEVRAGQLTKRYDVIILPSMRDSTIITGFRFQRDGKTYPAAYCGGIGTVGVRNLQAFVENGGILLCFGEATEIAVKSFWLQTQNVLEKKRGFSAPGSLLRVIVDNQKPVGYGMPRESVVFFDGNDVFELFQGESIVTYPLVNPLLSGWLQGDSLVYGHTALAQVRYGKGQILLYGFRPQHRGQTFATYKLVFNAVFNSAAAKTTLGRRIVADE